ncbi:MAG TPA: aspartate aminotransferase family protein [Longimicrobiales bacterium]|nr:aspartate aminotransferase family protein [Longimicrobiales bacterium]
MSRPREAPLKLDADAFRALGHSLVDEIAGFLDTLPERPVRPPVTPGELRALLPQGELPEQGSDAAALLGSTTRLLFDNSTFNGHPRFFGYITSSPAHIGILGDMLAAAVNPNCGSWTLGPMATEIESQAVRWIAELMGYPADAGGVLVSGGNVANFTCFLAARTRMAQWDVRAGGLAAEDARRLTVYASAETHTWIQKAADLFGLGTDAIRWIPTDDELRMDVAALRGTMEQDAARGLRPMMVVGTAGSVSTGAVDPLNEIADLCHERGVWFHVDGAYGGFAAAVPDSGADFSGMERADSVAVDPHKWLYTPLEAGCALVRDAAALREAFAYHPPYYHFGEEATNYVDYGLQNSRGFRALKVWLALRHAGRAGYERMIGDDIALTRRLHDNVVAHPDLDVFTSALSICTFRYVPAGLRPTLGDAATEEHLNRVNELVLDRIQTGGEAFVSNAVLRGTYVLRACIVNFNTTAADVDALPGIVTRLGREADAELRGTDPHGLATRSST